jgi:hypothetical protein
VTRGKWFLGVLLVVIVIGVLVVVELGLRLVGFWYVANFYRDLDAASRKQDSGNVVCLGACLPTWDRTPRRWRTGSLTTWDVTARGCSS